MEENLILKAYRDDKNPDTINIDLKSHTYGYEIYRIIMMLLDKILTLNPQKPIIEDDEIMDFINGLGKNYIQFYKK